jgi:hypothetical protein
MEVRRWGVREMVLGSQPVERKLRERAECQLKSPTVPQRRNSVLAPSSRSNCTANTYFEEEPRVVKEDLEQDLIFRFFQC